MSHDHNHNHNADLPQFTQEFWDERYASAEAIWSGEPNPHLVGQVAHLAPGDALDVGSGEGADAIWLASRGCHRDRRVAGRVGPRRPTGRFPRP